MIVPAWQAPGIGELAVILVIVLILFGAGKLPAVLKQLGMGMKAFKDSQRDDAVDVTPKSANAKELRDSGLDDAVEVSQKDRAAERS